MSNIADREDQIVVLTPPMPWVTLLLVTLCIGFYLSQSMGTQHLKDLAFSCEKFFQQGDILAQAQYCLVPTFYQLDVISLVANIYFIWVFGSQIESRLGNALTAVIVFVSILSGWIVLAQSTGPMSLPLFVGPAFLICSLLGGYLILMPGKKTNPLGRNPRYSYRIFAKETKMDPLEHFGFSPWLFVIFCVVYLVIMHLFLGKSESIYAILRPVPCLVNLGVGLVMTITLVMMITQSVETNPMRALARNRYKELRALDMTHSMAVQGTALDLGVPKEKVEEWLGTGARL